MLRKSYQILERCFEFVVYERTPLGPEAQTISGPRRCAPKGLGNVRAKIEVPEI